MSRVRSRLLTGALILAAIGAFAVAGHGLVHFGTPPPYDPPVFHEYIGEVIAWRVGEPALVGWVESKIGLDCPSLVVWFDVGGGRMGFVGIGPVAGYQRVTWSGYATDIHGHRIALATKPALTFSCYWGRSTPS